MAFETIRARVQRMAGDFGWGDIVHREILRLVEEVDAEGYAAGVDEGAKVASRWARELESIRASEIERGDHSAADSYLPRVAVARSIETGIRALVKP